MTPRRIEVRIEELVLEGVSPADRLRIGATLERELSRLLGAPGLAARLVAGGDRAVLDAGAFARDPHATPAVVGTHVARAVYAGLTR